ncbi:response regulator [Endozoicomonas sp. 4G]|uniref:response regulator n=1 Tax=Endozoicomonas sp. 4G TaxID=2872754 RepID=UPI002078F454|nr:response regulator [Endozoicomonas sp. 4G]
MPIHFRDRLSFKQARNTVAVAFILGLFLSLFQVIADYLSQDQQIDATIETHIAIARTPAARIAYNLDKELGNELVLGLIKSPTIVKAEIIEPSGAILATESKEPQQDKARPFTNMLFGASRTYIRELRVPFDEDEQLGWLKIVADTRPIGIQFFDRSIVTMAAGLVKTFLFSLVLFIMFYHMLTKPLLNMTDKMVKHPEERLPEPKGHESDEIGLLNRTINRYLNNIHHHLHHRQLAEEQLREHLSELETIIAQRTREIRNNNEMLEKTNRQLEKARSQAMETASQRARQLSSLSHEIRTPLNALLGMLSVALDEELTEVQRQRLTIARDSGCHLIRLLNDILDLSRLESGKMVLEEISFDLRSSLEDVVVLAGQSTFTKGVPIHCDIDPTLPEAVVGDPTRFHQVISNLIGNAAKFTDTGEIRVWLDYRKTSGKCCEKCCKKCSEKRLEIMLNISDTGIGIPESALDEVFKPFTQASSDTSRRFGGSGMGLSLTQAIVNNMGGQLSVISEPEKGSTFSVRLPFRYESGAEKVPVPVGVLNNQLVLNGSEALQSYCSHLLTHWGISHRRSSDNEIGEPSADWADILITESEALAKKASQDNPSLKVIYAAHTPLDNSPDTLVWLPLPLTRSTLIQALEKTRGSLDQDSRALPEPLKIEDKKSSDYSVLVVEDNSINRMVAEGMLEQLGYKVELAHNGEQCLAACQHKRYDLILMDCNMPVMDGYTTTRRLRDQIETRETPIIALTANALNEHKKQCLDAGMNDHLAKPINKEQLESTLTRWLAA